MKIFTYKTDFSKYIPCIALIFWVNNVSVFAQAPSWTDAQLDSILMIIKNIRVKSPNEALFQLEGMYEDVHISNDLNIKSDYYFNLYFINFYNFQNNTAALSHIRKALNYAQNYEKKVMCLLNIGAMYNNTFGKLDSSLFYLFEGLDLAQRNNNSILIAKSHVQISDTYTSLNNFEKAGKHIDLAMDHYRLTPNRVNTLYTLHKAIKIYEYTQDTLKVEKLRAEYQNLKNSAPEIKENPHKNLVFTVKPEKIDSLSHQYTKNLTNDKNIMNIIDNGLEMARIHSVNNNHKKSINILNSIRPLINDSMTMVKKKYFNDMMRYNALIGKSQNTLLYLDSLRIIENKIFNKESLMAINEFEKKYEKLKQEKIIEILNKEKSIAKRNFYIALLLMALLIFFIAVIFYTLSQKSKNYKLLETKNIEISKLLEDKEILLREIHHRVKNNLQIVSSLLNLQSNYITDSAALEAITEGKNRVLSMSLIHQNLYSKNNLSEIDTQKYLNDLIDLINESYNNERGKVKVHKDIDASFQDVELMIPIGLIVNELISNSFKHAFKEKATGVLSFTFKNNGDNLIIKISDNGVGIEPDKFKNSRSFGNKMIQSFVRKLKAELNIENSGGTHITIKIPKNVIKSHVA